jgi:hypothetical protein
MDVANVCADRESILAFKHLRSVIGRICNTAQSKYVDSFVAFLLDHCFGPKKGSLVAIHALVFRGAESDRLGVT